MKKILSIILSIGLAVLSASSCQDNLENEKSESLDIVKSDLIISCKGGEASIEIKSDDRFTASTDRDWLSSRIEGNMVIFTAGENASLESRYSKATITAADGSVKYFTIQQFGFKSSGFNPKNATFSSQKDSIDFVYSYEDPIELSCDDDWITIKEFDGAFRIVVPENTAEGTPAQMSRDASVSWKLGVDAGVIKISQMNLSFMKPDDNWNVHYDGVQDYEGEDAAFISNDVLDPYASGKYLIYYTTQKEVAETGLEMKDYLLTLIPTIKEELDYFIDNLAQYGLQLSYSDFLYEESNTEIFDVISQGDYYAYAIGFDDDLVPTGNYAVNEFTVSASGAPVGYEAWIGEWTVDRNGNTDTWKIVAKEKDETYTITGIEGKDYPVEAEYNPDDETLCIRAQDDLGTFTSSTYGDCSVGIFGGFGESSFSKGTYKIFIGTIKGDSATLEPQVLKFSDGSQEQITRIQFIATTSDGKYLTITKDRTQLPATLTRKGGSGGGGGDNTPYGKWMGKWNVDSSNGAFEISVSENSKDESMFVSGWQMDESFIEPMVASFSAEDGSMILYGNDDTPVASNVDIGVPEGACDLFYVGKFIYSDGSEYYITSGGSGEYPVATATAKSDDSAVIEGVTFKLSSGGEFTFNRLEMIAVPMSDPEGGVYMFNGKPSEFPLNMARTSSTSSIKLNSSNTTPEWVKIDRSSFFAIDRSEESIVPAPMTAVGEVNIKFKFRK